MEYTFDVEVLEGGQRKKYGDSYYRYRIVNNSEINYAEQVIKLFCTGFLLPSISQEKRKELIEKDGGFSGCHFSSYYTRFEKTDERTFEFDAVSPSIH